MMKMKLLFILLRVVVGTMLLVSVRVVSVAAAVEVPWTTDVREEESSSSSLSLWNDSSISRKLSKSSSSTSNSEKLKKSKSSKKSAAESLDVDEYRNFPELTPDDLETTTKALVLFYDRFSNIEEALPGTFLAPKQLTRNLLQQSSSLEEEFVPVYQKYTPTKAETGIDPMVFRLCAKIAGGIYDATSKSTFDLSEFVSPETSFRPEVVVFDSHGSSDFAAITPTFVVVHVQDIFIFAWEGSVSIEDWIRNFGYDVAASDRWKYVADTVSVQSAVLATVENDITRNEDYIIEQIQKRNIRELIFTGHSLGGALAQVGHVMIDGQLNEVDWSPWMAVKDQLTALRTVSFEGNTSILFKRQNIFRDFGADRRGRKFLQRVGKTSFVTVFQMDVVPRLYDQLGFLFQLIENLIENNVTEAVKLIFLVMLPVVVGLLLENEREVGQIIKAVTPYITVASRYDHVGKAIYFPDPKSKPIVYENFHELSRNVPYIPHDNVVERVVYDHETLGKIYYVDMFVQSCCFSRRILNLSRMSSLNDAIPPLIYFIVAYLCSIFFLGSINSRWF